MNHKNTQNERYRCINKSFRINLEHFNADFRNEKEFKVRKFSIRFIAKRDGFRPRTFVEIVRCARLIRTTLYGSNVTVLSDVCNLFGKCPRRTMIKHFSIEPYLFSD